MPVSTGTCSEAMHVDIADNRSGRLADVLVARLVALVTALLVAGPACGLVCGVAGCSELAAQRKELERLQAAGEYPQAAAYLDQPKTVDAFGEKNRLLWELERGAVALANRDASMTVSTLEQAEKRIELDRKISAAEVVGQWLINDTVATYRAEPYEDVYVNVLKLVAQLERGQIEGGATVEARRLGGKADLLRDQYVRYSNEISQKSPRAASVGPVVATDTGGEFVESTLGTYLSAVTFMQAGDENFQRVAAKRLVESIRVQKDFIGPVKAEDFADLEGLKRGDANVLLVAFSGRGPIKVGKRYGPLAILSLPVYFELPELQKRESLVTSCRVVVDGVVVKELSLVEDMASVALENHKRQLPLIQARTIARYLIKAGATVAVTETVKGRSKDDNAALVRTLGGLIGLGILAATEQADLRCWTFLPAKAHVGLLKLPVGEHRVQVAYLSADGATLYTAPEQTIRASEDGLSSVVNHYWR